MPTFRNDVKLGTKVPMIKTDDLDDRCVTEEKLAEGCVSTDKISQDAVTAEKIAVGSIGTEKLADSCVTKEKIADGAVTAEKLSGNIISDMKNDVAEETYEKMKEKFLPLTGGTIEGEDEANENQASTMIEAGVVKSENVKSNPFGIYTATIDKGIIKVSKIDDSKGNTKETQTISAVSIECERNYAGYRQETLYSISEEGVKANGFETLDQSTQGLLANNGSIATAISEGDIDEMFNK